MKGGDEERFVCVQTVCVFGGGGHISYSVWCLSAVLFFQSLMQLGGGGEWLQSRCVSPPPPPPFWWRFIECPHAMNCPCCSGEQNGMLGGGRWLDGWRQVYIHFPVPLHVHVPPPTHTHTWPYERKATSSTQFLPPPVLHCLLGCLLSSLPLSFSGVKSPQSCY